MDDLEKYIRKRNERSRQFAERFEVGYEQFKAGVMLRMAREQAGLTQEEVVKRLNIKKSVVPRD